MPSISNITCSPCRTYTLYTMPLLLNRSYMIGNLDKDILSLYKNSTTNKSYK